MVSTWSWALWVMPYITPYRSYWYDKAVQWPLRDTTEALPFNILCRILTDGNCIGLGVASSMTRKSGSGTHRVEVEMTPFTIPPMINLKNFSLWFLEGKYFLQEGTVKATLHLKLWLLPGHFLCQINRWRKSSFTDEGIWPWSLTGGKTVSI